MAGNAVELYNQGYYYYSGTEGYPLNHRRAFDLFQQAAGMGDSSAMDYLGIMYRDGDTVAKDSRKAAEWFHKALEADENNPFAAYHLAYLYYEGNGVARDLRKAYQLFDRAVQLGQEKEHAAFAECCYMVGTLLLEIYNNKPKALPYFVTAAEQGNFPEAWHNLGWLTEEGVTPLKNPGSNPKAARDGLALEFYEEAAKLGYAPSMDAVGRLYAAHNMLDKARPWIEKAANKGYEPAKKRLRMLNVAQGGGSLFDLFR